VDQIAGLKNAGLKNARLEYAGLEKAGPENAGQNVFHFLPLSCVDLRGLQRVLVIVSASLYISIASEALMLWTCRLARLCVSAVCTVCPSVQKVYCGKMAERIWMPFEAVSGVGPGMGLLKGSGDRRRARGSFVTNGTIATHSSQITLKTCLF